MFPIAHVPLQSFKRKDKNENDTYQYSTGTRDAPGSFPYPQDPQKPLFALQAAYQPSLIKDKEREGSVIFKVWPLEAADADLDVKPMTEGKVEIGKQIKAGDYYLSATEVRYWVGMFVRYEPGKPIVLASLWVGLGGMILTFIGRMVRKSS